MRVVLAGATGLIGRALTAALIARGDEVVALTRSRQSAERLDDQVTDVQLWPEPKRTPPPAAALAGADAVVNLLGAPVAQRWTEAAKEEKEDPTAGMTAEEAIHWKILHRKKADIEALLDVAMTRQSPGSGFSIRSRSGAEF